MACDKRHRTGADGDGWNCVRSRGHEGECSPWPSRDATAALGRKDDTGKLRWASLIPWDALREVVLVLEHGAKKYGPGNWKLVPDAVDRYRDALLRHFMDRLSGEKRDADGLLHSACIVTNGLFLLWLELKGDAP